MKLSDNKQSPTAIIIAFLIISFFCGVGFETGVQVIWLIFDFFKEANNIPLG